MRTVSWHRGEYEALGVDFASRGRILDEQLSALQRLWGETPASFSGEHFEFTNVYSEPKPMRARPAMWFGGESMHRPLLDRIVRYGDGFHPFGEPSAEDLAKLAAGLERSGRDITQIELVGGTRASFSGPNDVADIDAAMASFPDQIEAGFSTLCMKPSQHTDSIDEVAGLCRHMVDHVASFEVGTP